MPMMNESVKYEVILKLISLTYRYYFAKGQTYLLFLY